MQRTFEVNMLRIQARSYSPLLNSAFDMTIKQMPNITATVKDCLQGERATLVVRLPSHPGIHYQRY